VVDHAGHGMVGRLLRVFGHAGTLGGCRFGAGRSVVPPTGTGPASVLPDATPTWAYVLVLPSYAKPLTGASPTSTGLRIARLKP
jgi:hypothetical protein